MQDQLPHLSDEQLSTLLDDQLDAGERAEADQHLSGCAGCSAALADLELTLHALRALPDPPLPRSFLITEPPKPNFWSRLKTWDVGIRSLAAVAAAMFVVLLSIDLTTINRPAGITPLSSSARSAAESGATTQPSAAKSSSAPAAAPPITTARGPENLAAPRAAATAQAPAPRDDSARLEALTARDAASSAASPLGAASPFGALSPVTLAVGLVTVMLIIATVVRAVRRA